MSADTEEPRYLCIAPHYWAVGYTLKRAVKSLKEIGSNLRKKVIRFVPIPINVDATSVYVDEMGSVCWRYTNKEEPGQRWQPGTSLEELP